MNDNKVYVEVIVKFSTEGAMMPIEFIWEDGTKYLIDKVKSKERCASRKAGGTGIMYTVMVDGKECHLYYEFDKWFMERKSAQRFKKENRICKRADLSLLLFSD